MGLLDGLRSMWLSPRNPQTGDGKTTRDIYDAPRRPVFRDASGNKIKPAKKK